MALLEVENLQTHFRTPDGVNRAVDGVSFHVEEGETLAIVGESGCGKSVTAMSILRLVPEPPGKIAGAIRFEGRDLLTLDDRAMRDIRGNDISMIFQEPMTSLNPVLSIGRQLGETLRLHQGLDAQAALQRAVEMLALVGIADFADALPQALSGGMRMRVSIARALATQPRLLLMDEPFAALDEIARFRLNDDVSRIADATGCTIVFVTHSVFESVYLSHRIALMTPRPGRIARILDIDLPHPRRPELRRDRSYLSLCAAVSETFEQVAAPA
jgi:peptide/nickel transport system ATP-binding protein